MRSPGQRTGNRVCHDLLKEDRHNNESHGQHNRTETAAQGLRAHNFAFRACQKS